MMSIRDAIRFKSAFSSRMKRSKRRASVHSRVCGIEVLEDRQLLSTFTVSNLNQAGVGSLRRAILESNAQPGPDSIDFQVSGTIRVGRTSLPAITDTVALDGSTAPSFAGSPVVTVNFQGTKGLRFENGADGSLLKSLSLVKAGDAGVTLRASRVTVEGNYIGLLADGKTAAGNRGDGIRIDASSRDNLIGNSDPVTSVSYYDASAVSIQPVSAWQGIRPADTSDQYLMVGTSGLNGLLYEGPISGTGGASYLVNYPGATSTSVYGPDNLQGDRLRLVGSYKTGNDTVQGFLFEGTTAELSQSGNYRTIDYPGAKFTYVHSTMGGLAVGNADGPVANLPIGTGHAFLYDVAQNTLLPDIVYPGSTSTTAYGIWHNGLTSYTIVGGYSTLLNASGDVSNGFMVDYDSATGKYTNWTSFAYPNGPIGRDFITHFEGISSTESGVYTLNADSVQAGSANPAQGSWVTVRRNPDRSFGPAVWVDLNYPGVDPSISSSNSVAGNQVVGLVIGASGTSSFQATVNTGFQLSNVISGNRGNGIGIYGSHDNQIAMNQIGTDATGTLRRGNAKNGILVTQGAARNLIGGQATGGNDPTANVFVRPPQGNLISGNQGNGVLINKGATQNILSGNFVGTDASGNAALGNRLDGVAIENANGNQLIGCTLQQSPFVFYNVLSGNGGNGLRITNSNDTTVQANFMGVGANNATIVANGGNGLLVSGTSNNTQVGGVIPLGNVISGNNRNGIEVRDKASGFISFNTFAGIYAFGDAAANRLNGILITSSGGNNLIRTCIVSGNLGNGIELGGQATGVQVIDTAVGTNTSIQTSIPNQGSGIKISGNAHGNAIGGFKPSVEPQVTISSNRRYGIEFTGKANNNEVFHTYIGTNFNDTANLGNNLGGILLGAGTSSNTIGGRATALQNKILNSLGNGVTIQCSQGNAVLGNEISTNLGYGVFASGFCYGTVVAGNTITSNAKGNVNLTNAVGVEFIP
ncbi:right-handed parallel beta-helix repeat-containing protein [Singulisphaera sp. Ch08]|uniref:Right-handed parallel beta-helix repeat-containing protein n=1 Tax=Singulisphaera sp. Ch08 TaxID=3120278 RepID=A0AAU7CJP4_9BACT